MSILGLLISLISRPQADKSPRQTVTAQVGPEGVLVVTVNGDARTVVPRDAVKAWVMKDAKAVIFSLRERKRGYEGEGEALFRYEVGNKKQAQLLSEEYMVDKVYELTTPGGKTLLCVTMSDGGLGANHVALVNPDKGTVFARKMSRFAKVDPARIVITEYADSARWVDGTGQPKGRPTRYFTFVPDQVLEQNAVRDRPWR